MGDRIHIDATYLTDMGQYPFRTAVQEEAIAGARFHDLTERRDVLEALVAEAGTQNRNNAAQFIAKSLGEVREQIEEVRESPAFYRHVINRTPTFPC